MRCFLSSPLWVIKVPSWDRLVSLFLWSLHSGNLRPRSGTLVTLRWRRNIPCWSSGIHMTQRRRWGLRGILVRALRGVLCWNMGDMAYVTLSLFSYYIGLETDQYSTAPSNTAPSAQETLSKTTSTTAFCPRPGLSVRRHIRRLQTWRGTIFCRSLDWIRQWIETSDLDSEINGVSCILQILSLMEEIILECSGRVF